MKLCKTEPFEIIYNKKGIRYRQNRRYFNCGGYEVIDKPESVVNIASEPEPEPEHEDPLDKIRAAIETLPHTAQNYTALGLPRIGAVSELVGFKVSRREIKKAMQ